MSYIEAANKAKRASTRAIQGSNIGEDPGIKPLAEAIAGLADAIQELALSMNRAS